MYLGRGAGNVNYDPVYMIPPNRYNVTQSVFAVAESSRH
jgi:hypothetical protein